MKKIGFQLIAVIAMAVAFVACGPNPALVEAKAAVAAADSTVKVAATLEEVSAAVSAADAAVAAATEKLNETELAELTGLQAALTTAADSVNGVINAKLQAEAEAAAIAAAEAAAAEEEAAKATKGKK